MGSEIERKFLVDTALWRPADARVELPPWAVKEVSDDHRYFNSNLAKRPFATWPKD